MKTFKVFLEKTITDSDERKQRLSKQNALLSIKNYCSNNIEMIKKDLPLWRGFHDSFEDYALLDYSTGKRASQNMINLNTLFFDNNPVNKSFPKRSESIICTTDRDRAISYGGSHSTYALIPYNGVDIAIVNEEDIWDSRLISPFSIYRSEGFDYVDYAYTIQTAFKTILGKDHLKLAADFDKDIDQFTKVLKTVVRVLKNKEIRDYFDSTYNEENCENWLSRMVEKHETNAVDNILQQLIKPLSSFSLGFDLVSRGPINHDNSECWFSGPCIAIENSMWQFFRDDFLKGKF